MQCLIRISVVICVIISISYGKSIENTKQLVSTDNKKSQAVRNEPDSSMLNVLGPEESKTISIMMQTLLPSMFGLFSNITSDDYKQLFKEPCRFDQLLDIFKQLPPYFDIIASKFPNHGDIAAYYSMQLASTFLVNNGSLTMACLYNMLSLQTRLNKFSLDIMDNPERNPQLVGLFGIFMKPVMTKLKQNAMMKIIEHVDMYDKNDELNTINIFNLLNGIYIIGGVVAILSNILLIILLKRTSVSKLSLSKKLTSSKIKAPQSRAPNGTNLVPAIVKPSNLKSYTRTNVVDLERINKPDQRVNSQKKRLNHKKKTSRYKMVKTTNYWNNHIIRKRYKTRICFIIIAICHSLYILMNFIVMSQASLASVALQGLSSFNFACKIAFFLFPPTTAFNLLHQIAIWLLVYAIRQHGIKLRKTKTHNVDADADYEVNLMKTSDDSIDFYNTESDDQSDDNNDDTDNYTNDESDFNNENNYDIGFNRNLYNDDTFDSNNHHEEDTVSQSLTNNSQNQQNQQQLQAASTQAIVGVRSTVQFMDNNQRYPILSPPAHPQLGNFHIVATSHHYYQNHHYHRSSNTSLGSSATCLCYFFSRKRKNALFCLVLFLILIVYNAQNLFLYSLNKLELKTSKIYYCAFEEAFSDYYSVLTQLVIPLTNLSLFSLIPLGLCTMQVLFDICFLVRVKREQMKRYEKLKEIIEWPLYVYFGAYMISQLPFALHQISDLIMGTVKFPFVFPLFIQMKFSSKVWLCILEMTLIFLCYSSDLFIWIICDKQMRQLAKYWLNKRILCRTYAKSSNKNEKRKRSQSRRRRKPENKKASVQNGGVIIKSKSAIPGKAIQERMPVVEIPTTASSVTSSSDNSRSSPNSTEKLKSVNVPPNCYASSTLSSTASSSTNKKKHISPNIADSIKASAAIPSSIQHRSVYPYTDNSMPGIKMIDTDNEDLEPVKYTDDSTMERFNHMDKLDEDHDDEILKSTSKLNTSYQAPPPSFNTATRNMSSTHKLLNNTSINTNQYQNDFDLNIH